MDINLAESKHLNDLNIAGHWTSVNPKEVLSGVIWKQARQKAGNLNTIYTLVFQLN